VTAGPDGSPILPVTGSIGQHARIEIQHTGESTDEIKYQTEVFNNPAASLVGEHDGVLPFK
jgi:hypothetical protein